jgi:hypothetical protein
MEAVGAGPHQYDEHGPEQGGDDDQHQLPAPAATEAEAVKIPLHPCSG